MLHGASELETGKSNDSDAEYAAIAAHSRENCDADGLDRSLEEDNAILSGRSMVSNVECHPESDSNEVIRDAAQQLIGFSIWTTRMVLVAGRLGWF